MRRLRQALMGVAVALLVTPSGPSLEAVEIHGSARVYDGSTESGGTEADQLDQKYTLNLRQALTPWLHLVFTYRLTDFETSTPGGGEFERRSRDPRLELLYNRPNLSAGLSYQDRRNRGTNPSDNLDLTSLIGQLRWQPRRGPWYSLSFRDETNVADSALFGRDVESTAAEFEAIYDRRHWGGRYAYQTTALDNQEIGLAFDEDRHQARAYYNRQWQRVDFSFDGWISHREQSEESSTTVRPAQPLAARDGLAAIDTSPEIGELDTVDALVDGDLGTPVEPPISIGGADTFRNLGVDLGFTRQVTHLEITVDAPSSSDLIWEVYHSSDNLNWFFLGRASSEWDGSRLRYTLRFPETTDRYFKAVNLSINSFSSALVTEVRALVEIDQLSHREGRATTYRADLSTRLRLHDRVRADLRLGIANDEELVAGILSRDLDELDANALVHVDLAPELVLRVGYRLNQVEEHQQPVLERDEEQWSAVLDWSPLPTVDALLSLTTRDESDGENLIRSADTVRLRARTELLPDLELISEVNWSDIDDPFSGFRQRVWGWRETIAAVLTRRWTLRGSVGQSYFESTGTVVIERRTLIDLRTTWRATPYLSLTGDWNFGEDDLQETLSQRYSMSYTPGPRLAASLSYQDTESVDVRETTTFGGSVRYRLHPRLTPFANLTRSTFRQVGTEPTENSSFRIGLNLFF